MPDTTVPPTLHTPAEVAAAVLDAIESQPDAFDMACWFWKPMGEALAPGETPACGTVMCIAGWAAHLTGWTLHSTRASKGTQFQSIPDIGRQALGLDNEDLFHAAPGDAINALRDIAGR
ncbi:MAG TPA: hypothetical protein VFH77_17480 [Streptomyces sp.]|nr:hypothetical protein [Streptomyces sp.]